MSFLVWLAVYGGAVLAVGLSVARLAGASRQAFLLGDRSFGRFATWAALSSTVIGGSTTLVLATLIATKGLPGLWLDLAGVLGLLVLGTLLARPVRETGAVTICEVVGKTYGPAVRKVAAVLVVLAEIVWFALLAQATETVVSVMTGWDPTAVLVWTALLFVAYTTFGGQRAVVGTDILQLALMVAALVLVSLPLAISSLAATGVPRELIRFPTGPRLGPIDILSLLVLVGLPHAVGSDVWAKVLSARDAATARSAAFGAAASKLAFGVSTTVIALAGVGLGIPAEGGGLLPRTVLALAGPSLAPLLLVGLIATMQSSSDSVLLSASAATVHDLGGEHLGPGAARALVMVYGGLGLLVALWLRDLLETFRLGYTLFASGLILPTLAAFLPGVRVERRVAGAAMVLGGLTALAATALKSRVPLEPVLVGTAVNAATLLLGLRRRAPAGSPAA